MSGNNGVCDNTPVDEANVGTASGQPAALSEIPEAANDPPVLDMDVDMLGEEDSEEDSPESLAWKEVAKARAAEAEALR